MPACLDGLDLLDHYLGMAVAEWLGAGTSTRHSESRVPRGLIFPKKIVLDTSEHVRVRPAGKRNLPIRHNFDDVSHMLRR